MAKRIALFVAAVAAAYGSPISAQVQFQAPDASAPPPQVAFHLYKVQMLRLRDEARSLAIADGGTLSKKHDADIQRRIDRITDLYHRRLEGRDF